MPERDNHHVTIDGHLGTRIELRIAGTDETTAAEIEGFVDAELVRLEAVFSVFDPESELGRWRRGDDDRVGPELRQVLERALDWQHRSGGAFNPLVGIVVEHWWEAERVDRLPDRDAMAELAASIAAPRYRIAEQVERTGDCSALSLNAIAKGFVADHVVATALDRFDAGGIMISIGGDIAHRGSAPVRIGIENPLRPYDNEPPLVTLPLRNGSIASSGPARRSFTVAGARYNHLIDPRTGWPADGPASVSILATTACDADAVATAAAVSSESSARRWLEEEEGVEALIVGFDGGIETTSGWPTG